MKLLIIDDDSLVALSLKTILSQDKDIEVAALGSSGEEAVRLYDETLPDVLLMDIRMKGITGIEAGEQIIAKHPDAKILYLTTFNDDEYIAKALAMGAKGYIIKQDYEAILPAVRAVYGGQTVYGGDVMKKIPEMLNPKLTFDGTEYGLTDQENQVVEAVARGLSNKEIADELCLSEGTVRNYISNILRKLDLRDRTNLAIFYYTHK
ncbi:MAG: response regulator transcription factor [Clostridiales bacterium]|nr:response regulator transcription factor [Clostridiales bacterium]